MTQGRFGGSAVAVWTAIERWLMRRPKAATAAQLDEAARAAELAARREEADEAMRVTSRRVMREMWPPRPTSSGSAARSTDGNDA